MDKVRAKRIAAELQGKAVAGWVVGEYLGNGASAVVVSATRDGQSAALKLIDPEMVERYGEERQLARIQRERELIGHQQPHLVKIFDGGKCDQTGYLFVAMELLAHPELSTLVPVFPREQIGPIIGQIADAARFLESLHMVHRDIKPENIVITRDCTNATVLDLGVVKPLYRGAQDAGSGNAFLGTTRYSPPEYLMRTEEDTQEAWRAVTFYQIGAVLHDLIMRQKLFAEVDAPPARLIDAVRNARPVLNAPDVSPHMTTLARNCLQKDWRVRLELVRWEHFYETASSGRSADAKERIRQRIIAERNDTETKLDPALDSASRKKILRNIGGTIATAVREICLQSGNFPPLEIQNEHQDEDAVVTLTTGPSRPHALSDMLNVCFMVSILDDQGLVVRLIGTASIGNGGRASRENFVHVYSGDPSSSVMRERLDDFLHIALDQAQNSEVGAYRLLAVPPIE